MMKLLVLCALFSLAIANPKYAVRKDLADEWERLYHPHKQECVKESGVDEEDVRNAFVRGHYPDEHKFKCYIKCMQVKLKVLKSDGEFDLDYIKGKFKGADVDLMKKAIDFVSNETDVCQKVYLLTIHAVERIAKRYPYENKYAVRKDIADQWERLHAPHKEECVEESSVNEEHVKSAFAHGLYPDEHSFKCYIKCTQMKLKVLKSNGEYDLQFIKDTFKGADVDLMQKAIDFVSKETDVCHKAWLVTKHAVESIAKRYPALNKYSVPKNLTDEWELLLHPHKQGCIEETGVNEEHVKHAYAHGRFPNDHKFKCYLKCMHEKLNILKNGVYDLPYIKENFKGADVDLMQKSLDLVSHETDVCEKAYSLTKHAMERIANRYPAENVI